MSHAVDGEGNTALIHVEDSFAIQLAFCLAVLVTAGPGVRGVLKDSDVVRADP